MCGHEDKGHYAKGMCRSCYTKYGRTKKPWNCLHDKLYARKILYIILYNNIIIQKDYASYVTPINIIK